MAYRRSGPKELHFLPKIDCGMIQIEEKNDHLLHFYKHELGELLIFDEVENVMIKDQKIVGQTIIVEKNL